MRKKIKQVIPPRTIKGKITTTEVIECDFCYIQKRDDTKIYTCTLCKRDICYSHLRYDPEESGDYPDRYCDICYELKYILQRKDFEKLENDYYSALELLTKKVAKDSLNLPTGKE